MSSIDEKLQTFQELMGMIEGLSKEFEDGMNDIDGQFQDLKTSGHWNDPHVAAFESGALNYYKMSILTMLSTLKDARMFLAQKYETLNSHKN